MPSNLFKFGDWLYIIPFALLGMGLGIYGFTICTDCTATGIGAQGSAIGFAAAATHTLALIKASGSFPLDTAPGHLPLFFAQIIMPGLAFVGALKLVLQNVRRDTRALLAQRLKGHTIVCGLGDTGRQVVDSFRDAGRQVVVIALRADTPYAATCERRHVAVLEGDAGNKSLLKIAGLKRADSLIIACGSDGANLEIGMRAREILAGSGRTVRILPEVRSEWLYDLIKTQNAGPLSSTEAEFQLFNLSANAARQLLRAPFFLRPAPEAAPAPHLLFAGFGRVAAEILIRAARSNFALPGQRMTATVLDERGPASMASAEAASSGIREIADIEFKPCAFTDDDFAWQDDVAAILAAKPPLAVIVAVRSDDIALNTAMRLRQMLDQLGQFATPVFVRIREQQKLGEFLAQLETQPYARGRLTPFGGLSLLTRPAILLDQSLDVLARANHEIWLSHNSQSESSAAVVWDRLAEFHKQANRGLADYIPVRLRCCGLRLVNGRGALIELDGATVEKLAALEHWRWCVELRSLGWRYAQKRDDFQKLHNRLVDWDALPEDTKAYNREMARLLPQTADAAGMSIQRDKILFGGAALPASEPGVQLVVAADPANEADWRWAQQAQTQGAKIWALLRPGASSQLYKQGGFDIEALLSEAQWSALRQGAGL